MMTFPYARFDNLNVEQSTLVNLANLRSGFCFDMLIYQSKFSF